MSDFLDALRAEYPHRIDPQGTFTEWHTALRDIPRDIFVPMFFVPRDDGPGWRQVSSPEDEWAEAVLSNRALITQLNGSDHPPEDGQAWSTSSSSQPSLMLLMLHALGVSPGMRVLEIGTGSGYNAALLCRRIGSTCVTTIDIDPVVVDRARSRLTSLGYDPDVITGDGREGYAAKAPFDRILATVALPEVPHSWIEQTRDGGQILFPLDTRNTGGLMPLLTVRGDTAEGHFLSEYGGFMPLRHTRHDYAQAAFRDEPDETLPRETTLAHQHVTDEAAPFQFFAALRTRGYDQMSFTPGNGDPTETWLALPDGSWVCHTTSADGTYHVRQGGPQRLWDRVEALHNEWITLGQPPRERFGLTVTRDSHTVWLEDPDGPQWQQPRGGVILL